MISLLKIKLRTIVIILLAYSVIVKDIYSGESDFDCELKKANLRLFRKLEVCLTLPFEMVIEQVELRILNQELFKNHLKILSIHKSEDSCSELLL